MRQSHLAAVLSLAIAFAATVAVISPGASAQAAATTIITDPAGDQTVTPASQVVVTPPAMNQVDIVKLSAAYALSNLTLTVDLSAAATATETITIAFSVQRGPTSMDGSTASGATHAISILNGAATGVTGATVSGGATNKVGVTFPISAVGAVGGDLIANLTVTTQDTDPGSAPAPVTQDDSAGSDRAPDTGTALPYTLPRPAVQAGLAMEVTGGTIHQRTPCASGKTCPATFEDKTFTGSQATTSDGNATVRYTIEVTNTGTDSDLVNLGISNSPAQADATLDKTSLNLLHGSKGTVELTVALHGHGNGVVDVTLQAATTRGKTASVETHTRIELPTTPPPPAGPVKRTPVPEQLAFMTPLVTGVGLDKALGDFAELAAFALFLLIAVVAVYLVMFLVRTPWVKLQVTPKRALVAPGGTAEFKVQVSPRRKRAQFARGMLRGDGGAWRAGLQMGRSERLEPGTPIDLPMTGEGAGPVSGTLRVQVPPDATSNEREVVEFDFVPVDASGAEHPSHRARGKVTVEAAPHSGYASARDIQLAEVKHEPIAPRPGSTVTTTATIRNAGGLPANLRVVLLLDGKPTLEQRVEVPAKGTRSAMLPWTAGAGKNQVKVQIFLA